MGNFTVNALLQTRNSQSRQHDESAHSAPGGVTDDASLGRAGMTRVPRLPPEQQAEQQHGQASAAHSAQRDAELQQEAHRIQRVHAASRLVIPRIAK